MAPKTTYRDPATGAIYDATGNQIRSLTDYQARVRSGELSGSPLPYSSAPFATPYKGNISVDGKQPVSLITTSDGLASLNEQKEKLDRYAPLPKSETSAPLPSSATESKPAGPSQPQPSENEQTQSFTFNEALEIFGKDFSGLKKNSDGTWTPDASAWERVGISGMQQEPSPTSGLENDISELDNRIEGLVNNLNNYNVDTDPAFMTEANDIRNRYSAMREEMKKTNYQRQRALETLGYRTGSTQFAGSIQSGIVGEEIKQADDRLSEIARQENLAIMNARTAFEDGNYKKFSRLVDGLQDIRKNKADALTEYNKKLADAQKAMQEEAKFQLDVLKYQLDLANSSQTDDTKEYSQALKTGFKGSFFDYLSAKTAATTAGGNKPFSVAPGSSIFDPVTNTFIGTAPDTPGGNKPITEQVGDNLLQWDPETGGWSVVFTVEPGLEDSDAVLNWAKSISNGQAKFSDVPDELKTKVNTALNKIPPSQKDVAATQQKISELESLLSHPGLNSSVGPNWASRIPIADAFGNKSDFIAKVQKLLSEKTLQSLIDAKAQGATFGALSEGELKILQEAASTIGTWVIKDKNGNVKGYNVSQKRFKEELDRIKQSYKNLLQGEAGATDRLNDYYNENPDQRNLIDSLENTINPETNTYYTDEEKLQILGIPISFNMVGDDTNKVALGELSAKYESGGNPGAIGYDSTGGYSYGTYQLAHNNAQKFIQQSPYAGDFKGLTFNSPAWRNKWQEVAKRDPQGFSEAQKGFISSSHFEPQVQKLAKQGIDLSRYSDVLKDVIWSTVVQHGPATNIIASAFKLLGGDAPEKDLIKKIYSLRWGGGKQFSKSTPQVRKSVYNRFFGKDGELQRALKSLG